MRAGFERAINRIDDYCSRNRGGAASQRRRCFLRPARKKERELEMEIKPAFLLKRANFQSCRSTLSGGASICSPPLYLMRPAFLNLFIDLPVCDPFMGVSKWEQTPALVPFKMPLQTAR
jgi:hypothetical protein